VSVVLCTALAVAISSGNVLALAAIAVHRKQRKRCVSCAWFALASTALSLVALVHGGLVQITSALAVGLAAGCAALRSAPFSLLWRRFCPCAVPKQRDIAAFRAKRQTSASSHSSLPG
jgi:hypothetical protein